MDQSVQDFSQSNLPDTSVMSVGNWMITMLITMIPLVNIVMLLIWSFGDNTNLNKANWAKASLIYMCIVIVFYLIFFLALGALFFTSPDIGIE